MQRDKVFHVSPFIEMNARYHFRLSPPDESLQVLIREFQGPRLMLVAAQVGTAAPFCNRTLLRAALSVPFMTLKVMALIHWQALKIWLRGAPFIRKPAPPKEEIS
jgi:DUF1365 family protein